MAKKVILSFSIAWFFIVSLFLPLKESKADYVYLKDGSIISGILLEEKEKVLVYRTSYGEMFINRENVDKIVDETKDKPLLREAEKYLKDKKFKQAIKTCGEALEINSNSVEALELKQKAIEDWRKYEDEREEKIRRQKEEQERKAKALGNLQTALKNKSGIDIKEANENYVIVDIFYNCPLTKGELKPGDILIAIQDTKTEKLSIKKVYDLLVTLKKIDLTIQRSAVLTREKILWQGTKEYVGLGISIEKVDNGIKVTNLMPDGPAAKAGLLKDDIITSLGSYPTSSSSMDDIIKILKGNAGTSLKAVIERKVTLE